MEHALEVRGVSLRFGGVRALTEVSFGVNDGELFSIIGPNGAGKTSIVNCISGRYKPTEGQLFYRGQDITGLNPNARPRLGIGRTFQNLALFHHMSVLDNIMVGRHHLLKNNFITGSLYWLTGARREELEHRRKVEEIIDFLDLQSVRKATAGTLPYGLRKRVELARAMALEPQLILLDEPMAGMNFEEKEDMARYIVDLNEEFGMTVMMIEHDMGVVMDISHRVMVLDFGRKIAEGDPAAVLADPHVKRAYLGEEDEVLVDPDDKPAARGERGMMDYAGRVAQADTYPKLLRLNAREHGGEIALREKDFGLWKRLHLERLSGPGARFRARHGRTRPWPRRRHRHHRRQPSGLGVRRNRRPRHRRHVTRPLSRRAGRGSRLPAELRRGQTGIRRGRGAGRQAAGAGRPRASTPSTSSIPTRAACGNTTIRG